MRNGWERFWGAGGGWQRYWRDGDLPPQWRYMRGQLRFGLFVWFVLLTLGTLTMLVLTILVAVTGPFIGLMATAGFGAACLLLDLGLWRCRRWWWPPYRKIDLWTYDRRRRRDEARGK
jgi:hypothetical protein